MTALEEQVSAHYTTDDLMGRIKAALIAAGADPGAPKPADLKPVDEFHTGGLEATEALLGQLSISQGRQVLDIGCGLGGTARFLSDRYGADVTAFDLTPDYVETARKLTAMVGLEAEFLVGSALEMPVGDATADLATMFHVGMNVSDKAGLMSEVARVLRPGGQFALFDVMRVGGGDLTFPFPWAEAATFSFVEEPGVYRDAGTAAGLEPVAERERKAFTLDFFERAFAAIEANGGPPPMGIHLLMRETAGQKIQNYVAAVKTGTPAPVEMIWRKQG